VAVVEDSFGASDGERGAPTTAGSCIKLLERGDSYAKGDQLGGDLLSRAEGGSSLPTISTIPVNMIASW